MVETGHRTGTYDCKPVEFVLEKYGKGLVYLALAESYLEKGKDIFEIFSKDGKGVWCRTGGVWLEQVFVGTGILAWLSVLKNDCRWRTCISCCIS